MEDIIGILLYNSFIELPGSNQAFGKTKDSFNYTEHVKQGEKTCYIMHSQRELEKV